MPFCIVTTGACSLDTAAIHGKPFIFTRHSLTGQCGDHDIVASPRQSVACSWEKVFKYQNVLMGECQFGGLEVAFAYVELFYGIRSFSS